MTTDAVTVAGVGSPTTAATSSENGDLSKEAFCYRRHLERNQPWMGRAVRRCFFGSSGYFPSLSSIVVLTHYN